MKWFIIFVTLSGVQFARGTSNESVDLWPSPKSTYSMLEEVELEITSRTLARLNVKPKNTVQNCKVRTNTNEEYEYTHSMITNRISASYSWDLTCSITVSSFGVEDAGKWEITAYTVDEKNVSTTETFLFKLFVAERANVSPVKYLYVYEGYYVHVKIDADLENITNCQVISPQSNKYNITPENKGETNGFELFGQCGIKFQVNKTHNGRWTLRAIDKNNFITYTAPFEISVKEDGDVGTEMVTIKLTRGMSEYINIVSRVTFCQIEDPYGNLMPVTHDECSYKIPTVTSNHDGIWRAHYGVLGKMTVTNLPFRVITSDKKIFSTEVSRTENNDIKLLCRLNVTTPQTFKFCRFTKPDGIVWNLTPGIGTRKYTTFPITPLDEKRAELVCGLIIHDPNEFDYGGWKCTIGSGHNNEQDGSLLYVDKAALGTYTEDTSRPVKITAPNVYVKRSDSFKIKCEANAILNYCWFRSPNGTVYSVSFDPDHTSPSILAYEGAGLSLGECGARINHAVDDLDGEWTCNMGIANGTEKSENFRVHVTDSYLIMDDQSSIQFNGEPITLSFRLLPSAMNNRIQYCRWIHPNGAGIYNNNDGHYTTENTETKCKLIISSKHIADDIGRWTCVAGLLGTNLEETTATVYLVQERLYVGTVIGLALSSIILFIISGCFVCIIIRKRRRALPMYPPRYSAQGLGPDAYLPPKSFK